MAIIKQYLLPEEAQQSGTSGFAPFDKAVGTNFPVGRLLYDATADEAAFWHLEATNYGTGDWTVDIDWYAVNATSNVVRWGVAVAAITPETDSQDAETKAFDSETIFDDTHLGTTSKRIMRATITVASADLDGVAGGDECWLRVRRIGSNGSDTMANDAALTMVRISYSDT
ncbi:hypothetical protein GCM10009555_017320 [Acrocarpospora macrocephala]|uniref:Uncharacterized protein n=1 Tax=Acrocarpospora macrocephala TaxID=150177 RepID=A0A5M3WGZ0_9ACTN|nr:hypothetical protein [Acrocarpospora macrocephala]GES07392.1 hypothetical protein Amac_009870 [Acrocarpospora macrocephala]